MAKNNIGNQKATEGETPTVAPHEGIENDTQAETSTETEVALAAREKALAEREAALAEREAAFETELNHFELTRQWSVEETETPREGLAFSFRDVAYKFDDNAPERIRIGDSIYTQEEIADSEELLVELIAGNCPLIVKL